jgi:hypothetical protein
MSIIRSARKERDFAILANSVLQDSRLSMRALGLLVRLLSRPDNWETNSEVLAREFNCGREQMRAVLGELRDSGYMQLVKSQDAKGHWSSRWMVLEEPEMHNPKSGQPETGNRVLGQPDAINNTDYKEPIPKARASLAEGMAEKFNQFWNAYPKKVGKDAAQKAFAKRKPDDKLLKDIFQAVELQKTTEQWQKDGGQYIPNPATWLNQGRWMDEMEGGGSSVFAGAI